MAHYSAKISSFPTADEERRRPAFPAGNENAANADRDPTQEVRNFIEQLQDSLNEARAKQRAAEEERNQAIDELTRALDDANAAHELEKQIKVLEQECDALSEQQQQYEATISELKKKLETAERQRLDALRQREETVKLHSDTSAQLRDCLTSRDETVKQRDSILRQRDLAIKDKEEALAKLNESHRQLAEAQKTLLNAKKHTGDAKKIDAEIQQQFSALRLARDASAIQVAELKSRIGELDDEVANLGYDLETADKATKQAAEELDKVRAKLEQITGERDAGLEQLKEIEAGADALRKQVEDATAASMEQAKKIQELSAELEAQKKKNAAHNEVDERLNAELKALRAAQDLANKEHEAEVNEIRLEIEILSKEREAEIGEFSSKLDELRKAYEAQLALSKQQNEVAVKERDSARQRILEREAEYEESRSALLSANSANEQLQVELSQRENRIQTLSEAISTMEEKDKEIQLRLADAELRAELAEHQNGGNSEAFEDTRNSLIAAQKQIEYIIRERDTVKKQVSDNAIAHDAQLKERRGEIAQLKQELEKAQSKAEEHQQFFKQYEAHRMQMIEISAQLENAHQTIREMGASLAEARIMAKRGMRPASIAVAQPVEDEPLPSEEETPAVEEEPVELSSTTEKMTDKSERKAIGAMRHCFQALSRKPDDLSQLNELSSQVQSFADRARKSGQGVLHRVSAVFASLLQELYELPEQITPLMLRTVNQTIDFLAALLNEQNLDRRVKLATARIYAVDDDRSVSEMITEGLKSVGLKSKVTKHPSAAVAELSGSRYDLIILDVQLPDLDGFELCTHIRNMALHAETPIIFLTGNASQENRIESSLRGGNEFLAKPFNIQELSIRALTLIIKSQVKMS